MENKPKVSPIAAVSKDPAAELVVPRRGAAYMGSDSVYYCENSAGHVYITSAESPIREGYVKKVAETVYDIDYFFARMNQQEKQRNESLTEEIYRRNEAWLAENRSNLQQKLMNSDNEMEKDIIRAWIEAVNNKTAKMQRNSVYGVAAMQEKEAPIKSSVKKETVN